MGALLIGISHATGIVAQPAKVLAKGRSEVMHWGDIELNTQHKVLNSILRDAEKADTPELKKAFETAYDELMSWLNVPMEDPPGYVKWAEEHAEELKAYYGQAVLIHPRDGIVVSGAVDRPQDLTKAVEEYRYRVSSEDWAQCGWYDPRVGLYELSNFLEENND
jgi:hypothetical protein